MPDESQKISPEVEEPLLITEAPGPAETSDFQTESEEPLRVAVALPDYAPRDSIPSDYAYISVVFPIDVRPDFIVFVSIDDETPLVLSQGDKYLVKVREGGHTVTIDDPLRKRDHRPNWESYDLRLEAGPLEFLELRLIPVGPRSSTALKVEVKRFDTHLQTLSIPAR